MKWTFSLYVDVVNGLGLVVTSAITSLVWLVESKNLVQNLFFKYHIRRKFCYEMALLSSNVDKTLYENTQFTVASKLNLKGKTFCTKIFRIPDNIATESTVQNVRKYSIYDNIATESKMQNILYKKH